jgi:LacI family transcriptional regulator
MLSIRNSCDSTNSRVSAADVARQAGVSPAAVSYVMNGRPGVSLETRERVVAIAQELGFRPNQLAATLSRSRSHILGLVLSQMANPFYPELAIGVTLAARTAGYQVFLAHTEDDEESLSETIRAMLERSVDGIVLTVARSDNAEVLRQLRDASTPFVQLSRFFPQAAGDFVGIDDRSAAVDIMRHVLGHRPESVATVVGPRTSSASLAREQGFVAEALRVSLTIPGNQRASVQLTEEGGRRAARHLFSLSDLPRAIVCGSDAIAIGVLEEALLHGLRVPEDIMVTGFDGISVAIGPLIDLTSIVQPHRLMAQRAVEQLTQSIEHRDSPIKRQIIPHYLRIGSTCGCPRKEILTP